MKTHLSMLPLALLVALAPSLARGQLDLTVTSVSGPATGQSGTSITVSATIASAPGTGAATPGTTRFFLSTDSTIAIGDYMLGEAGPTYVVWPGQSGSMSKTFTIPSNVPSGTYYLGAIIDFEGRYAESNETNNALAGSTIQVTYVKPDFTVTSVTGPAAGQSGSSITVSATVASAPGTSLSAAPITRFFLSTDANIALGDYFLGETDASYLQPGQSGSMSKTFTIPSNVPSGTYYLGAIADIHNYIAESNETNNALAGSTIQVTYVKPDFTVTSVTGPAAGQSGSSITVSATVASAPGTSLAAAPITRFYLSSDATIAHGGDYVLGETSPTQSLQPGQSASMTKTFTIPSNVPTGTYFVGAIADIYNYIAESDDTNNALAGTVITVSKPDLTITGPTVSPPAAPEGGTVTISAQVQAQPWGTGAFWVGFYLSTDSTITSADSLVASAWVPVLPPNTPTEVSAQVVLPALPPGAYRVGAIVDLNNQVAEANETNNSAVGASLTVGVLPDTTPPALTVDQPLDGEQTTSFMVRVSGRVVDESPVTLRLDGGPVSLAQDGTFGQDAYLRAGDNLLTLEAVDAEGNRTTRTLHVGLNAAPLSLAIATPTDGFVTSSSQVFVAGSVTGGVRPLRVAVNGQAVPVASDGTFQAILGIAISPVITASAVDAVDGRALAVVSGTYDPALTPDYRVWPPPIDGIAFDYDAVGNLTKVVLASTDSNNCGAIGRVCRAFPGASASCQGGACGILVDGVHVDLTTNLDHCGAYRHACAGDPNGSAQCVDGACALTCQGGFTLVDGRCVDLLSDVMNCGLVHNECTSLEGTAFCSAGACRDDGVPAVSTINGIAEPGVVFRTLDWNGLVIRGANLHNVTQVEFEVCGDDSFAPDWTQPGATSCIGEVYSPRLTDSSAVSAIHFDAVPGRLVIKGNVLRDLTVGAGVEPLWPRTWHKLRLHYLSQGLDTYVSVHIPFSLATGLAQCSGPSVSSYEVLRSTHASYDPASGRLEIHPGGSSIQLNSNGRVSRLPHAVLGVGPGRVEYAVLGIDPGDDQGMRPDTVYIQVGLEPGEVLSVTNHWETWTATLVYTADRSPGGGVDLGGYADRTRAGVQLRGACLDWDGAALLTDGAGVALADTAAATWPMLDRALVDHVVNPRHPLAWVAYTTAKGTALTPGPVSWGKAPEIFQVGTEDWLVPNQVITIVGDWFVGVQSVVLSSYAAADVHLAPAPTSPPGPWQYFVVDDTMIQIAVGGQTPDGSGRSLPLAYDDCGHPISWINDVTVDVSTSRGTALGVSKWVDPTLLRVLPNILGPRAPGAACGDQGVPGGRLPNEFIPLTLPPRGSDCSNGICEP